ncbi:MAG TPA: HAMP domain-containing sensor histidine kinase [Microbacteriaceae bacterium]|nr:HAMP domain-containing sensor histidine kinase [Microbacteriaceae bacterium]
MSKLARRWDAISLRTKITGVTVLLLTAGLIVAGLGTMAVLRGYLLDQVDRQLGTAYKSLESSVTESAPLDSIAGTYFQDDPNPLNPYYLAVVDSDGHLLDDNLPDDTRGASESLRPNWDAIGSSLTGGGIVTVKSADRGTQWRLLLTTLPIQGTEDTATLVIGSDLDEADETVARFGAVFLFFALTVVILGGALTRLLATTTFLPLRRLEDQAARFADGDYNQRMTGAPPNTEVGRLTRSLNTMLARIDAALADRSRTIDQMRRFVGDASHELRTPLVTVRGYAELYRMGALSSPEDVAQAMERIEKEAVRMAGLVEDLLELARLDASAAESASSGASQEFAPVDLIPLANDAASDAMAAAPDRTVTVVGLDPDSLRGPVRAARPADTPADPMPIPPSEDTLTKPITLPPSSGTKVGRAAVNATGPISLVSRLLPRRAPRVVEEPAVELPAPAPDLEAVVLGAEDKVRQVIANLMGNAMRFSPDGSPLEIGIGVDALTRRGVVAVIDHGEGVPAQIRDKIFQRFWRADSSRDRETGGNGLGLAIVAAIVQAHRGTVDVVDTPGGGATFRVWLPLA